MTDISHGGSSITIIADTTFPSGFTITEFPDDTDPLAADDYQIGDGALGTNGTPVTWSVGNLVSFTIAVLPNTVDHANMATLFQANRLGPNNIPVHDVIKVIGAFPEGGSFVMNNCSITAGTPFTQMAQSGRKKTPTYTFKGTLAEETISY